MTWFWNFIGFIFDLLVAIFFQFVRAVDLLFRRLWYPKYGIFEALEGHNLASHERQSGPILLVHGLNMDPFCLRWLRRKLLQQGFGPIFRLGLQPFSFTISDQAKELAIAVAGIHQKYGAVHIVAHSLGGVVSRYYIQELEGYKTVASLVTLGSPHQGTPVANLAMSVSGRQLLPSSEIFKRLNAPEKLAEFFPKSNPKVPSLFLWANLDLLVPPRWAGKIPGVPDQYFAGVSHEGHTSILVSPRALKAVLTFISAVVDRLASAP